MNMIDRIPDKYAEKAFMGKNEERKAEIINTVAETINSRILNPIDDIAKRKVNGEAVNLIEHLAKAGEWQANSVDNLVETARNPNKTANKEIAEDRLDILAKATYIAMRYGDNNEAFDALQGGSVEKMLEMLPEVMKNKEFVERIRNLEITNPGIQGILNILDKKGRVFKVAGEGGKKGLRNNLEEAIEKLASLDDLDEKGDEEMMRVSAYLGAEVEGMSTNIFGGGKAVEEGGKRVIEPPINLLPGKDEEQTGDQLGTYRALSELEGPQDNSHEEISKWALRVTDNMARGSLFFAGSWQQIGPYIERQIEALFAGDKSMGVENRKAKEREYVQALLTCRIQEQAILHCDGDPSKYASFLPPPDVMNDYMWNKDVVDFIEGKIDDGEIGTIGEIRRYLRQRAYTSDGGLEIAKGLKDGGGINIFAQELAEKIKGRQLTFKNENNDIVWVNLDSNSLGCEVEVARTAIALFIVEDYAQWSLWSCKTSTEEDGLKKVPWMKAKEPKEGAPNESTVWTKRVMDKTGRLDWVQAWGADFSGSVGKTCVQHPYFQFMRPVDLYRVKSSWNEEILQPLEESLCDLALRKWAYDDKGNKKDGGARNMLSPSKVGAKDFNRWNAMVSTWVGKSQADALDSFKDWLSGAEQLKSMLAQQSNVLDLGGEVAGDIFYAKVRAFMSMQKDDFLKALSVALTSSGDDIRELQAFKADLLGSTGFGEFGQLFESISRINLHMGTEKYYQGMAMLQTGVGDPEKAVKLLNIKKKAIIAQGALNVLGGLAGQKKR